MKVTKEIHELLREGKINTDAAIRLMLEAQVEILERLAIIETERIGSLENRIKDLVNIQEHYPSLLWLWHKNRKGVLFYGSIVVIITLVLLSPVIRWLVDNPIPLDLLKLFGF